MANSVALGGHVEIGDGVIFGGLSAVQQFCRVGKGAMVGGLTGVNRDVIPYAMAFGDHAELAGLNLIGLKRRGLSRDTINAIARRSAWCFMAGGGMADRARAARAQYAGIAEVAEIADFILADAKQECAWRAGAGRRSDGSAWDWSPVVASCRAPWPLQRKRPARRLRGAVVGSFTEDWIRDFPHEFLSPGEPGRILKAMRGPGVTRSCWRAGGRAEFNEMKLDAKGVWCRPRRSPPPRRATTRCCVYRRHLRG